LGSVSNNQSLLTMKKTISFTLCFMLGLELFAQEDINASNSTNISSYNNAFYIHIFPFIISTFQISYERMIADGKNSIVAS